MFSDSEGREMSKARLNMLAGMANTLDARNEPPPLPPLPPKRESQVEEEISSLHAAVVELENIGAAVIERLSPVLRQVGPEECSGAKEPYPDLVPLADGLHSIKAIIFKCNKAFSDMLDRIEL